MSYLSKPRIGFFSTDAMTNPSTGNNENVIHLLDYNNVKVLNPPQVTGAELPKMSPAAYREWMTSLITSADHPGNLTDPTLPNWVPQMPGYWNYYGDHLTTFGSAHVTSVWLGDEPVTPPAADPLLGANVTFNARIVDVNPADTFASQFVTSGFSVVGLDKQGAPAELIRGVPTTSITRWLNFSRAGAAGTFQAVIPNDALAFIEEADAPESDGLAALRQGAAAGGGLLLRWCFYGMTAATPIVELYDSFQQGETPFNPKVGRVVGSIGVWNGTDLVSAPVGRVLQMPGPPYFPANADAAAAPAIRVKTHEDVERMGTKGTVLHAMNAETPCEQSMGPAAAVVDTDRVVLDLNTAFPEIGCSPGDLRFEKAYFGVVNLELVYPSPVSGTPQTAVLGPVSYDEHTYEQFGGVWEVPFDPASEPGQHIQDGLFQLRDAAGNILLREVYAVQVVTDDQAVYLDLEQTPKGLLAIGWAALRVFDKGEPAPDPVTVKVEVWADVQTPGEANSVNPLVVTATQISEELSTSYEVSVPAGGVADVPIQVDSPGCYKLRYIPPGMPVVEDSPNWAVEYFSTFRVLPYDDYSHLPDDEITFELVFEEVFKYYSIIHPIMSKIIPWGPENQPRDPERVAQFAALIKMSTDESRLGTALEMPITRELSAGKRALLQRWCDLQLGIPSES